MEVKRFKKTVVEFAKSAIFRFTRFGRPRYTFNITPGQLAFLMEKSTEIYRRNGVVRFAEIGVARGMTARFLLEYFKTENINYRYMIVDTFSSFVETDLDFEVNQRGKERWKLQSFGYLDFKKFKENFASFDDVEIFQADASSFDFQVIAPIDLVLLDVDLYLPTKAVLAKLQQLNPKPQYVLVDDVLDSNRYDGAYQAYHEFLAEPCSQDLNLCSYQVGLKGGVIEFKDRAFDSSATRTMACK